MTVTIHRALLVLSLAASTLLGTACNTLVTRVNPQQVGLGVQMGGIQQMFGQGSLQSTGLVTDLAIQGNGFFVLSDRGGGRSFSRAGNFTFDRDGDLITQAGKPTTGRSGQPEVRRAVPVR